MKDNLQQPDSAPTLVAQPDGTLQTSHCCSANCLVTTVA